MIFKHTVPILYSADVLRSISYYVDVLGFESKWTWGEPPTFGGVSKNSVEIFFCEKGQGNPGTWISIMVDKVDEYHEKLKSLSAKIISPPQSMEWGLREMLVEDPDGHCIRFGQGVGALREHGEELPAGIRIIRRIPTEAEYKHLVLAVGWASSTNIAKTQTILAAVEFAVVAEDIASSEAVGCAMILSDKASFYYIKDVMVHPKYQCKRIGTALMQALTDWLEMNAADNALVGLFTGENLMPFYKQFGFSAAFGMQRRVRRQA